jgi:hypothetical protein
MNGRAVRANSVEIDPPTPDMSGALLPRFAAPNRPEKIRARYADAAWFSAIGVRIAKSAGSGAHFQLSLDGPGNEGPLGGN